MMDVRVLGCYGREMPGYRTTSFMVDGRILIDAGAAGAALPLKDQARIDHIFLTHSHLDHFRDIPFIADNIFGKRDKPFKVYGLRETIEAMKKHVFNFSVWPDFTKLPNAENPIFTLNEIQEGGGVDADGIVVLPIRVNHSVPAAGYIVSKDDAAFAFSGDTGPTQTFWDAVSADERVRVVFLETTFPNRLAGLAREGGHLTPALAEAELQKTGRNGLKVFIHHMIPPFVKEIQSEFEAIDPTLRLVRQGDRIKVS